MINGMVGKRADKSSRKSNIVPPAYLFYLVKARANTQVRPYSLISYGCISATALFCRGIPTCLPL